MAEYPAHLARGRRLADGRSVLIRPIRVDDGAAGKEFLERLDYESHMAFVCEAGERLVGDARYVANADRRGCEFGIVVADDWHRTGVAQLLMDALIRAARARGFETMAGLVLSDNSDMLAFVRSLDFELAPAPEQAGLVRVVKKL
jgi:acetyltransferase